MNCHQCHASVAPGSAFCEECGARLENHGSNTQTMLETNLAEQLTVCTRCGAGLTTSLKFCYLCGVRLHHADLVTDLSSAPSEDAPPVATVPASPDPAPVVVEESSPALEPEVEQQDGGTLGDDQPNDESVADGDVEQAGTDAVDAAGSPDTEAAPEPPPTPPAPADPRLATLRRHLEVATSANQHDEIVTLCEELAALDPDNTEWESKAALARERQQAFAGKLATVEEHLDALRFAEAKDLCAELSEECPGDDGPRRLMSRLRDDEEVYQRRIRRAERLLERNDYDGAVEAVDAVLQKNSEDPAAAAIISEAEAGRAQARAQEEASHRKSSTVRRFVVTAVVVVVIGVVGVYAVGNGFLGGQERTTHRPPSRQTTQTTPPRQTTQTTPSRQTTQTRQTTPSRQTTQTTQTRPSRQTTQTERTQSRPTQTRPTERRNETQQRPSATTGVVRVRMTPAAEVIVDGWETKSGRSVSFELSPGAHTLNVQKPGYFSERRNVSVAVGKTVEISITLKRK